MKAVKLTMIAGLSALALAACSNNADTATEGTDTAATDTMVPDETAAPADPAAATTPAGQNIVVLAQGNGDLSTLVSAVTAADLGTTLSGPGPFTVFAPTNAAFAKVDKATMDTLLKPESKAKLGDILKYHVVAGNVKAADLAKQIKDGNGTANLKTVNGATLKATLEGDKVILTDAKGGKSTVTATDIVASNGTVHTIDTVVMPS